MSPEERAHRKEMISVANKCIECVENLVKMGEVLKRKKLEKMYDKSNIALQAALGIYNKLNVEFKSSTYEKKED